MQLLLAAEKTSDIPGTSIPSQDFEFPQTSLEMATQVTI